MGRDDIVARLQREEITWDQAQQRMDELRQNTIARPRDEEQEPIPWYGPVSVLSALGRYPNRKLKHAYSKRMVGKLEKKLAKQRQRITKKITMLYGGELRYEGKWFLQQRNEVLSLLDAEDKRDFNIRCSELEQLVYPDDLLDLRKSIEGKLEQEYKSLDRDDIVKTEELIQKLNAAEKQSLGVGEIKARLKEELKNAISKRKRLERSLED